MNSGDIILVIGGTGAMGSAVVRQLATNASKNWRIRVLTRNPDSPQARALMSCSNNIEFVRGDVLVSDSLKAALDGVAGVFCNTDYWTCGGLEAEIALGIEILELARQANVDYFVYSSGDNATVLSGGRIPVGHMDAKAQVQSYIEEKRTAGDMWYQKHTSGMLTLPYMDNFQSYFVPQEVGEGDEKQFIFTLPIEDKPWPMVALDDIGWFAAHMFDNDEVWKGRDLPIASEVLSGNEIAKTFSEVTGIAAQFQSIDDETFLSFGVDQDVVNMFHFIREYGLVRDLEALRKIHPGLLSFRDWLKKTGWRGEARPVQKFLVDAVDE